MHVHCSHKMKALWNRVWHVCGVERPVAGESTEQLEKVGLESVSFLS